MKKVGIIKRVLAVGLIFLLSINSFAASTGANDGSAFITKAEFDSLKNNFQAQIDTYNQNIDSKIDSAIAAYLGGIKISRDTDLHSYVNDMKTGSLNGNDYKFIYAYPNYGSTLPTGCWFGVNAIKFAGKQTGSSKNWYGCVLTVAGSKGSIWAGGLRYEPATGTSRQYEDWDAYTNFNGFYLQKTVFNGNEYWAVNSKKIHKIRYLLRYNGGGYHWSEEWYTTNPTTAVVPKLIDWYTPYSDISDVSNTEFSKIDSNGYIKWVDCVDKPNIFALKYENWYYGNTKFDEYSGINAEHKATYEEIETQEAKTFGCMTNTMNQTIYYIDESKIGDAVIWKEFDTGNKKVLQIETSVYNYGFAGQKLNQKDVDDLGVWQTVYARPYRHDIKEINVNTLINATATNLVGDAYGIVYLYNGEPLCKINQDGQLHIKLSATPTMLDGSGVPANWSGKLYLSRSKFGQTTTKSNCKKAGETSDFVGYWNVSNSQKNLDINLDVKKDEFYWLKFVLDTNNSNLAVHFETQKLELHSTD